MTPGNSTQNSQRPNPLDLNPDDEETVPARSQGSGAPMEVQPQAAEEKQPVGQDGEDSA